MTRLEHLKINLSIALPVVISQLGHIMVSVADSIMVGQLGVEELAGVALGNSVYVIFMVFGLGVAFGLTPLVAFADGNNSRHLQGVLLRHSFWINLLISICLMLLTWACGPVVSLLDQDPEVVAIALPYMFIVAISLVPQLGFISFKQFAEGLGDTKVAMFISVGCNLINVGLNYVLIYGSFGFPQLGVNGAAWATLIARVFMAAAMWYYVLNAKRFQKYDLSIFNIQFRKKVAGRLLQVGIPSGLQYIFEVSAFSIAAILAGMIGAMSLAAHQIAINIASVSYMAVTGLGAAATVRVGKQAGRRDFITLRGASWSIFGMASTWMLFTGAFIFLFRYQLAAFYTIDQEVIGLAVKMLIVVTVFQLSDGLQAVALGALRGFTDVKIPTAITFASYWVLTLPLAYYLAMYTPFSAMGIWYALATGLTISAGLLIYRYVKLLKRFTIRGSI
jgi:MATE family multidrug resistance protein